MLKSKIEQDFKTAFIGGDKLRAEVLRNLKSAILYEEVAKKARDTGLADEDVLTVLAKEAKKRGESAELYKQAGANDRAETELAEKKIIEEYLPTQLSDAELAQIVDDVLAQFDSPQMGQVIGAVRQKAGIRADGGRIATLVKEKLQAK